MVIKKFTGKTEVEAVEAARKELGSAVVIMNVKKNKPKGVFSFLKSMTVEVTAALEDEKELSQNGGSLPPLKAPVTRTDDIAGAISDVAKLREKYDGKDATADAPSKAKDAPAAEAYASEKPAAKTHTQGQSRAAEGREEKEAPRAFSTHGLSQGVGDTRKDGEEKPEGTSGTHPGADPEATPGTNPEEKPAVKNGEEMRVFRELLYSTMLENEVEEKNAKGFMGELDRLEKPDLPLDVVLASVYQKMILKFGKAELITPAKNTPKVAFFVGPTGVGKTTTIAKIASKFCIMEKKKVALLTTDTYRIAAAEQLRTYANILEIPLRIVYSPEELKAALAELAPYDYVLIDTAGHSHRNNDLKEAVGSYIQAAKEGAETEVFLVLSASTKSKDLLNITDSYADMAEYKLIFTKLDETDHQGNLLNIRLHTGAAMSYVTNGQNVPNDIGEFNPQRTVKLLLGGK